MKKLKFVLGLFILPLLFSCDKDDNDLNPDRTLLGIWKVETEKHYRIENNDTVFVSTMKDGRLIELKGDSVLILYQTYPIDYTELTWYRKGNDSIYLHLNETASNNLDKYRLIVIDETEVLLEETIYEANNEDEKGFTH